MEVPNVNVILASAALWLFITALIWRFDVIPTLKLKITFTLIFAPITLGIVYLRSEK